MRILSLAPLAGPGLETLRALGDVEVDPWIDHVPVKLHAADELVARLTDVDALIVEADHVGADVIERTSLRFIGVCRGDPVNVDVAAATRHGVVVIRTPGRNANAVADLTLALMLAILRSVVDADDDVRAGRWFEGGTLPQQRYRGRELASCSVGLVGFGAIGRLVAARVHGFGARVCAFDPAVDEADMRASGVEACSDAAEVFSRSDIVSIHAPLNDATRGMIGEAELARARPGTLLVNTARFDIVEEEPLIAALRDGRLAGAAFDHFHNEFLATDHPLTAMRNVVLTPHIGGSTIETIENHTRTISESIAAVLDGKIPPTVVDPSALAARP